MIDDTSGAEPPFPQVVVRESQSGFQGDHDAHHWYEETQLDKMKNVKEGSGFYET